MLNQDVTDRCIEPAQGRSDRDLSCIPFLAEVSPPLLEDLSRRCRWAVYEEGEALVETGQSFDRVFFVTRGEVRFSLYTRVGKVVVLRGTAGGLVIGGIGPQDQDLMSPSLEAVRPSTVGSLPTTVFMEAVQRDRGLLQAMVRSLVHRHEMLAEQVVELTTLNVDARVHSELVRMCRGRIAPDGSASIVPSPTHAEIAKRVGTHREAVSRVLSDLQHRGVVVRVEGRLFIPDVSHLA